MKKISISVGNVRISSDDQNLVIAGEMYGRQESVTFKMSEDLKHALISFTALLIETEE